ncbi:MAG: indolepyruvate ferredoxin oxidoreductase subunit alpha [Candidatus Undinarchaeales archaeon]|jgi:indolepyruvate ferredoxin oxidoreductase alpha subunit|nr:indolepyruvate ferredoxin oxidoreductase subunit alpha [Candidatus Undinarchaeales archaeon]MDP7493480.1 indolepyruvate ferredoxin oxidoreductase subunit alpha [Candidatus Undinarchaeales archaeon]
MSKVRIEATEGAKVLLMGNEAVARGALEAGVTVASGYPGTPSSEIIETLAPVATARDIHVEWSINEKVALEVAAGASYAGARALVTMKHVGLNVAADPFMSLTNTGTVGGLVVAVGDDPGMHSSQNEQDSRMYVKGAKTLTLVPADPQEAKDFVVAGFELSERFEIPVILRLTTRVCHTRGPVTFGPDTRPERKGSFTKDPGRFIMIPANARRRYRQLLDRQPDIMAAIDAFPHNRLEGEGDIGVIATGPAARYAKEAVARVGLKAVLLTVATYPPPLALIKELDSRVERIYVFEDGDPFLEEDALRVCTHEVRGKVSGHVQHDGEMTVDRAMTALGREQTAPVAETVPPRPPVLCPGCSHRSAYYAMKRAKCRVVAGDIGCYTLGLAPPLKGIDTCLDMGASIGKASGMDFAGLDERPSAVIGDSTFFHSGITGLINAVYNKARITVVILDNRITAMTGHQENPGTGRLVTGEPAPAVDMEALVRACGVEFVQITDPQDISAAIAVFKEANAHDGVSVVILRSPCVFKAKRKKLVPVVDGCNDCQVCINTFGCPAIVRIEGGVAIDEALCTSCGVCVQICPHGAFVLPGGGDA